MSKAWGGFAFGLKRTQQHVKKKTLQGVAFSILEEPHFAHVCVRVHLENLFRRCGTHTAPIAARPYSQETHNISAPARATFVASRVQSSTR